MRPVEAARRLRDRGVRALGGVARARVVLVLGATLGLDGADKGTLSTVAGPLEHAFGIGNTQIGVLTSVVSLVGAICTVPVGFLTDRSRRTRLLAISAALWVAAMALSGMAPSYGWLLASRAGLGAVSATAGPTIASLTGDFFPVQDRARMYGMILGGELVGTAVGFSISGVIAEMLGWRFAFWWLIVPGALLVWVIARLPEPTRGGQSRLREGQEHITDERQVARGPDSRPDHEPAPPAQKQDRGLAQDAAERAGVEADEKLVLRTDPRQAPPWRAIRYVLRVPTNRVLIVASALGYFFFTGMRSFATLFATRHYGVSTAVASSLVLVVGIAAMIGVLVGGRVSDRMLRRGRANARVVVPTACLLAVPVVFAPGVYTTDLALAIPLLCCGTLFLGAANPPLDAARLDIIHPYMWGTAEGVRSFLRTLGEAAAPILFGYVSSHVFGHGHGLQYTLLLFLIPLLIAASLGFLAIRTYPRDVATADASIEAIRSQTRKD